MIKAIALRFGYVESNTLSWFVFQTEYDIESRKEAFHSLAEFLYQRYLEDHPHKVKPCCKKSLAKDPESQFCPKCGHSLIQSVFDYWEWTQDLEKFRNGTIDGSGYMDGTDNPHEWDPTAFGFGVPEDEMIIVDEQGAEMLAYAVAELHPELKEDIDPEVNSIFYQQYLEIIKWN